MRDRSDALLLFGATGDLAGRMLLPSLFALDADGLVMAKQPGLDRDGIRLREVPLDLGLADAFADSRRRVADERLLLDLLEGDPTLFVRRDEVEAQWEWIGAIRAGWAANGMLPPIYPAGTWGPSAAIALTERDGVSWHD